MPAFINNKNVIRFTVVGAGYVGLSLTTLLATRYPVTVIDIIKEKVDMINARVSPILDKDIETYLSKSSKISATDDFSLCAGSDYVIIATPTNYDANTNEFDTRSVESSIDLVNTACPDATIVIKSTVPIGFVEKLYSSGVRNVLFSPEFLREGKALHDNLYPSRIVVGTPSKDERLKERAASFAEILRECSLKKDVEVLITGSTEAESIKLFSNSYLALRISYFNELDTFAEINRLNSRDIIKGVCLDARIGDYYNNPSFGYGGYCLPKDSKQLLFNYNGVPERVMSSTVESNSVRKEFVSKRIADTVGSGTVGVYRLIMKLGSDNFRESSVLDVIDNLKKRNIETIIFEPTMNLSEYHGCSVINDIQEFKDRSDLIVANRMDVSLEDVLHKVYTRDIFLRD
ncbi:MAG: nucleotide sugar dehydrogenase [Methanomassiliicoccaceae archaeon]|nr:nucleotide sugar dehydrogenase [Methanomassiliicoccaceae archaeon]